MAADSIMQLRAHTNSNYNNRKRKRSSNANRGVTPVFRLFYQAQRDQIKSKVENANKPCTAQNLARFASILWQELSSEERMKYSTEYEAGKEKKVSEQSQQRALFDQIKCKSNQLLNLITLIANLAKIPPERFSEPLEFAETLQSLVQSLMVHSETQQANADLRTEIKDIDHKIKALLPMMQFLSKLDNRPKSSWKPVLKLITDIDCLTQILVES